VTADRRVSRRRGSPERPVRIAIVGAGAMGKGLLYQATVTPGVRCVGVADLTAERAVSCIRSLGLPARAAGSAAEVRAAWRRGEIAACSDGELLATAEPVDVLIESSSSIGPAMRFARAAIEHGKHLVLMNSEIDLAFGPLLLRLADEHGVTYTSCDGDQHTVLKRLTDSITAWGFELVMAGNIKGFLDRYADPTSIAPEAARRDLSCEMCTAYTDGTKLNIEMALLANGIGLSSPRPGMNGPRAADVREVLSLLDVAATWREHGPYVDYILGAEPGGGVFAVGHCDHPYQQRMMAYYKMGEGPFYLFYRPYHLCHVEAMECVLDAARGRSLLAPVHGLRTNVFAHAKRPLRAGEVLDGIGGYTCYGLIDNCGAAGSHPGLPICLAAGGRVLRDVPKDAPVLMRDVRLESGGAELDLYRAAQRISGELAP
jgi:predicted homoserine dehydrogenase-like protein